MKAKKIKWKNKDIFSTIMKKRPFYFPKNLSIWDVECPTFMWDTRHDIPHKRPA